MAFQNERTYTITVNNMDEFRTKLFNMYGDNYKVVNKKQVFVSGGFLGLQKKGALEVTYILVDQPDNNGNSVMEGKSMSDEDVLARNREEILKNQSNVLLNAQLNQINSSMQEFMSTIDKKLDNMASTSSDSHESITKIENLLEQNEFTMSYIRMISEKIRNTFSLDELDDFDLIQRRVVDWIGESINITKDSVVRPPHVYIIVGPTGVGKTTTLVKMAVQFVKKFTADHEGKPNICFITTDTMRVGAMEQLSRWGEHMETSVLKAERSEDLIKIFNENKNNVDAIFIDTSGYSPNDATHLAQIKLLLEVPGMNPDVYLAATASTKARDLHNIMKNYEPFGYNSVIITKCDESEQLGNVISVLSERHKSISYITSGQIASRDISKASIVNFLINLEGFKVDRVHIESLFGE